MYQHVRAANIIQLRRNINKWKGLPNLQLAVVTDHVPWATLDKNLYIHPDMSVVVWLVEVDIHRDYPGSRL